MMGVKGSRPDHSPDFPDITSVLGGLYFGFMLGAVLGVILVAGALGRNGQNKRG